MASAARLRDPASGYRIDVTQPNIVSVPTVSQCAPTTTGLSDCVPHFEPGRIPMTLPPGSVFS